MKVKELKEIVKSIPQKYDNDDVYTERYAETEDGNILASGREISRVVYDFMRKLLIIA